MINLDNVVDVFQDNIRQVVGQLWENVLDGQRFAILKEKGAVEEVVKSFSESLRNDVFALENQVRRKKFIFSNLVTLSRLGEI